mgnify:FL=1
MIFVPLSMMFERQRASQAHGAAAGAIGEVRRFESKWRAVRGDEEYWEVGFEGVGVSI